MRNREKTASESTEKPNILFIPLERIPAHIVRTLLYIEDFNFFRHPGFSIESIRFAIKTNKRLGFKAYGGSTITQQLARTLFLYQKKSYFRKYLELIAAIEMEILLPKERILELYINYIEWGRNIYGIGKASEAYFNKTPDKLTGDEVLGLITIMPSPLLYSPDTFYKSRILSLRHSALSELYAQIEKDRPRNTNFSSTIRKVEK
jgi:monofunctional glycosyltransferase